MQGINLDKPILYKHSSLRFFEKNEHHIKRFCPDDVLLLVYEGVLRFSENGVQQEVHEGEYYIQKHDSYQDGELVSDSPKYLYVHFLAEWSDGEFALPYRGTFNYQGISYFISKLDYISRSGCTYTEKAAVFFDLLTKLHKKDERDIPARHIADLIDKEYLNITSLEQICEPFHYSKNHVINLFKEEYGMTPFEYINDLKIKRAMYLLEVTSRSIEEISEDSGFNHYSHFYRLFLRKNGVSPFEWRNRVKLHPSS